MDKNQKILDMIQIFFGMNEIKLATKYMMECICELYHFQEASIYMKNDLQRIFFPIERYQFEGIGQGKKFVEQTQTDETISSFEQFQKYLEKNQFLYVADILEIKPYLEKIQYEIKIEATEPKQFYLFYFDEKQSGYLAFEGIGRGAFEDDESNHLNMLCRVLGSRVQNFQWEKKFYKERFFNQYLIENEKFYIGVIRRDTYEVVYYNNLLKTLLPTIEYGSKCYAMRGEMEPCEDCYFLEDEARKNNMEYPNQCFHISNKWDMKGQFMTLENEVEVYLICAKNGDGYADGNHQVDILTGSPTLLKFKQKYNELIIKKKYDYAVFTLDIDKFKYINSLFGYQLGDEILRRISITIANFLTEEEFYCRMNEDKFAMLIRYSDMEELHKRMEALDIAFQEMRKIHFSDRKVTLICGISLFIDDATLDFMIDRANVARKSIKGSHKNAFKIYNSSLDKYTQNEKKIEARMLSAVKNNEFVPYFQPKFNLQTEKICGAEALVRWNSYDGLIFPDEFIPVFENNGFITILDFVMYQKVFEYLQKVIKQGVQMVPISLNVSRVHIKDPDFLKKILKLMKDYQIPKDLVELEVTENVFMEDKRLLKNFIRSLREENFKVSIDDFGTAYSSLNVLKDIDVDVIKIDKEFLHHMNINEGEEVLPKDKVVIRHVVEMAKELNFEVLCEGIETREQMNMLKEIGCTLGQGYIFAKPMPLEEFEERFFPQLYQAFGRGEKGCPQNEGGIL